MSTTTAARTGTPFDQACAPPEQQRSGYEHLSAPPRSRDQRMEALRKANRIRVRRSQLKRDLKQGDESIVRVLASPPEYVETAKVFDVLIATPKWGRVKVNRMLANTRISPSKTMGGLSDRQRAELVALAARHAGTRR